MTNREARKRGRPTIDDELLGSARDYWVTLLEESWSEIGWSLNAIRNRRNVTVRDIRELFSSLVARTSNGMLLPFVDDQAEPTEDGSISRDKVELRKMHDVVLLVRSELDELLQRAYPLISLLETATSDNCEARELVSISQFSKAISLQQKLMVLEEQLRALDASVKRRCSHFCQAQLLDFVKSRRYALEPRRIANAAAGLPEMRWRQSYNRCSRIKYEGQIHIWYQVFKLIERLCQATEATDALGLSADFERLLLRPTTKLRDARNYLATHWYTLRNVLSQALQAEQPSTQLPFSITAEFIRRICSSQDAMEQAVARSGSLKLPT